MKDQARNTELCQRGEKADKQLNEGKAREALKSFQELQNELEAQGDFDSYIAAKITLGTLRCFVKLGDFKNAFKVWNASLEDSLHGIGIYALESAQTNLHDMVTYDMLCAFLHTLAENDKDQTASAVNQYLSRVCEASLEDGDRATMRLAISNWKQHLREIYGAAMPFDAAKPLIHFEKILGDTVKPLAIDFPKSGGWEKPRDFLEMSKFVEMKGRPAPGTQKKTKTG